MELSNVNEILFYVSGSGDNTFEKSFLDCWDTFLTSTLGCYEDAGQLLEGNRLRPKLVCWGFLLAYRDNFFGSMEKIAVKTSICVESIHKASIILDDLIDSDVARNGKETFHKQYSEGEASIFSGLLINEAICLAHEISASHANVEEQLLMVVRDLATGALLEFQLQQGQNDLINATKEVIAKETMSLIRNSLLMGVGYIHKNEELYNFLFDIGNEAAYIFQVLNDMEPFFNPGLLIDHKGTRNFDLNKNKKNMVCAYLYSKITEEQKKRIASMNDVEEQYSLLQGLVKEYGIFAMLDSEINEHWRILQKRIKNYSHSEDVYINAFEKYITRLYNACRKRALEGE